MTLSELLPAVRQLSTSDKRELVRLLTAELSADSNPSPAESWAFLVARPHPWRRQQYIKGRKLMASTLWQDLLTHQMSPEEAAENWDLPIAAIQEAIQYCETHQALLKLETQEEKQRMSLENKFIVLNQWNYG